MAVFAFLLLLGVLKLIQAGPHSRVMRTQMDVDYTGRVRQAPGANSIQTGGHHEIKDEEEEGALGENAGVDDEDEVTSDWQQRRVPNLGKPVQLAVNQMASTIKKSDSLLSNVGAEVIRQAASIPFNNIDNKGTILEKAESKLQDLVATGLDAATDSGLVKEAVDLAVAVEKNLKDNLKGKHSLSDKIVEAVPAAGLSLAQNVASTAGQHIPKLIKNIQDGDAGKILANVQDHKENGEMDGLHSVFSIGKDSIKDLDPATALKVATDAAQLAQDVQKVVGEAAQVQNYVASVVGAITDK